MRWLHIVGHHNAWFIGVPATTEIPENADFATLTSIFNTLGGCMLDPMHFSIKVVQQPPPSGANMWAPLFLAGDPDTLNHGAGI